jgi:hypothetical protein
VAPCLELILGIFFSEIKDVDHDLIRARPDGVGADVAQVIALEYPASRSPFPSGANTFLPVSSSSRPSTARSSSSPLRPTSKPPSQPSYAER